MMAYVALLRAVNVGGTGKLPLSELVAMCEGLGFSSVKTYIASGNVVFSTRAREGTVKAKLEEALHNYAGKPVGVMVRTAAEVAAALAHNPFPNAAPNRTLAIFLDAPPPDDTLDTLSGRKNEEVALGVREVYVNYGDGMGTSKLKSPAAKTGTARNMNTIAKLAAMAAAI